MAKYKKRNEKKTDSENRRLPRGAYAPVPMISRTHQKSYAEWKKKEMLADEDIAAGRYDSFDNMDDFIKSLD